MKNKIAADPYLPLEVEIVERTQESPTIFSLHVRFIDPEQHQKFTYHPGQFNMIYLYGVGEVAISIVSDPEDKTVISHTIRALGRVTKALAQLKKGDHIAIRGPFGRGWPLLASRNKDLVIITGGLGCAPAVSIINYIMSRRKHYGHLKILQGVKHSDDFIFREQYKKWARMPHTEIHIAADEAGAHWPWGVGYVTDMIQALELNPEKTVALMCGPEMMMHAAIQALMKHGVVEDNIYLSMERNMACGIGHCGHCQYGGLFVCKDGPIFTYPEIKALFHVKGF